MPRYPTCIYCRRNDSEPSREDIFAKWLARQWPDGKKSRFHGEGGPDGQPPVEVFDTRGHWGLVTFGPCKRCNNTWMSDLETDTKPLIKPMMIDGAQTTLATKVQRTISQWAVKNAINYEYRRSKLEGTPRYFKPADRWALFKHRDIPAHTRIYLGHYIGDCALWTTDMDVPLSIHFPGHSADFPAYSMTFAVGQLAVQIFTFRWPVQAGTGTIRFGVPGAYPKSTVQIWPVQRDREWPPVMKFDDVAMDQFAATWRNLRLK